MKDTATQTRDRALGAPMRWLSRIGNSELVDRLGLRASVERLVYRGARDGFRAAQTVASTAGAASRRLSSPKRLEAPPRPKRFDLTPTDEQQMVRDTMRRFATDVLRPAAEDADEACTPPQKILEQAHELGVGLLAIPEELGGAAEERSPVTGALIAEELARGDTGLALAALAPLGVINALVDWGTAEQQEAYLPRFTDERFVGAALALLEPRPMFDPFRPLAGAVRDSDRGWRLYGDKCLVPLAGSAEIFCVSVWVRGLGPRLFVVEAGAEGLTVEDEPAMGLRAAGLGRLRLDGVPVSDGAMLGEPGREGFDLAAVVDRARIGWSALAVGTAQAVLDYVIPYCNERSAFGEPISHRQSVAFLIADMAVELEGMRLLAYRAASRVEQGLAASREATLARLQCADKGMKIGTDGVQLLGGHGFVKDHPVERWYRHLRAIGLMEGAVCV